MFARAERNETLRDVLRAVCGRSDYHVLELEVEDYWTRLIISLKPADAPAKAVQSIKANSSRLLFEAFPGIEREIGRRSLWSPGYYVRGVGDVSNQMMNNTSHWFRIHNPGVFEVWDVPGLRTAGAATTNQVRNHLKRKEMLAE